MANGDVARAAEQAAREAYGALVAKLAVRTRDIAAAEDALSEAFLSALRVWPERGIPSSPEAWLLTAARRSVGHDERHRAVQQASQERVTAMYLEEQNDFPDQRLKLLFICAHPAIDVGIRTPLMLQTVLGLDAARISAAFVTTPATMSQRLVRAKTKIRDAGIAFEEPEPASLAERLDEVLQAIYAAYGLGWDAIAAEDGGVDLTEEALFLGRLVAELLPQEPEPKGLLALMSYCESRREARRDDQGRFVPLHDQDPARWSRDMLIEAEGLLTKAARAGRFGRFQTEAAIQSIHAQQVLTGQSFHEPLLKLYDALAERYPTVGVLVNRAVAYGMANSAETGLRLLDELPAAAVKTYQPYWVARLHFLSEDDPQRIIAKETALKLTHDLAIKNYLKASTS